MSIPKVQNPPTEQGALELTHSSLKEEGPTSFGAVSSIALPVIEIKPAQQPKRKYTFSILPSAKPLTPGQFSEDRTGVMFNDDFQPRNLEEFHQIPFLHQFSAVKSNPEEGLKLIQDKDSLYQFLLLLNSQHPQLKIDIKPELGYGKTSFRGNILHILNLAECACGERYNRYNRSKIEDKILFSIESRFKDKKQSSEPLRYVSIGSEEALQDWILLAHLIVMGFNTVEIHLCDLKYSNQTFVERIAGFEKFFSSFPGIKYSVMLHPSMEEFAKLNIASDVVLALDFEGTKIYPDDQKPIIRLSDKGFAGYDKEKPHWKLELKKGETPPQNAEIQYKIK